MLNDVPCKNYVLFVCLFVWYRMPKVYRYSGWQNSTPQNLRFRDIVYIVNFPFLLVHFLSSLLGIFQSLDCNQSINENSTQGTFTTASLNQGERALE